jgi:hypothetical protein
MLAMVKNETITEFKKQALKALIQLEKSFKKVSKLSPDINTLSDEECETWEAFSSRFARASDILISKYFRALILQADPGWRGTLRDSLDQVEKLKVISSADEWLSIRELRNSAAHEYTDEDLSHFHEKLRQKTPTLLALKPQLL